MQLQRVSDFAIDKLNSKNLPEALLVIPDGNGRWAKEMGKSVFEGHKKGAKSFAGVIESFLKTKIKVLGAWGFSEDNWKRPQDEIDKIMLVIENVISENLPKMVENNVKFIVLGKHKRIQKEYPKLYQTIENAVSKTSQNSGKIIALFVDYGEKFQLEEFAKARAENPNAQTYELLSKINQGLPLFDMVLRTSGELRLSGFGPLASLAEYVSVKKNLPELNIVDFANALVEYSKRERRLGGRPSSYSS
ncbi:MAG: di-trans,poly-cis-decaprenylcistransferase [Candidatus Levybacteria bacterium RIFCSPHIGHO2_01_FULL_37_17]|nr:MAG: di-trans,poly-cis-decaprenylcistransferase [Candidatus Levybacteria bacterium RIFCSPHIGHO2_01_FULL_37_17]OGH36899.1 MAG: di-trans,poly-cis-decaprenylcistransferase [Candidatus Levybacteria bacterium RIFCSPLOWO2_01_FULL_38_23]